MAGGKQKFGGNTIKMPRREYTAKFTAVAVKRVKDGLNVDIATRELALNEQR